MSFCEKFIFGFLDVVACFKATKNLPFEGCFPATIAGVIAEGLEGVEWLEAEVGAVLSWCGRIND